MWHVVRALGYFAQSRREFRVVREIGQRLRPVSAIVVCYARCVNMDLGTVLIDPERHGSARLAFNAAEIF